MKFTVKLLKWMFMRLMHILCYCSFGMTLGAIIVFFQESYKLFSAAGFTCFGVGIVCAIIGAMIFDCINMLEEKGFK